MGHQGVLEFDRGNPFAARLDDILGAIGDLDVAIRIDRAYIARAQPAVVEFLGRIVLVVFSRDPWAANFDLADRFAVPGKRLARVDDAQVDAGEDAAGFRAPVDIFVDRAIVRR